MAKTGFYIGSTPIGKVTVAYKSTTPSTLQEKSVVPTKTEQSVLPDTNYDALSKVTVAAIPDEYQNISEVTASAEDVIQGKKIVNSTGVVSGTMSDNGTVSKVLDTTTKSYTIPSGKHSGAGVVSITTQEKSVTPSTSAQEIVPDTGKVLSKVTVAAVTSSGIDTSDATATSDDILSGKTAYVDGAKITGNIPTQTASSLTAKTNTVTVPAGYYATQISKSISTGTVNDPMFNVSASGLVTATVSTSAGYVTNVSKQNTYQLPTQAAKIVTPSTTQQTAVASGKYTTGDVYVSGDLNLVSENIKSGVTIFNVAGTYEGSSSSYRYDQTGTYFAGTVSSTRTITFNIAGIKDVPLAGFIVLPETTLSRPSLTSYSLIVSLTCMDGYGQGDTGDGSISVIDGHKWEYTTIGRSTGITFSSDADSQFSYTRSGSTLTITSATTSIRFSTISGERYRLYPICANTVYANFEGIPVEEG